MTSARNGPRRRPGCSASSHVLSASRSNPGSSATAHTLGTDRSVPSVWAVAELPGLDLAALRTWLDAEHPGLRRGPLRAEVIAGGKSNLTYRVSDDVTTWALRRPPLAHVLPTAHDMAREFRVVSALAGTDVPVA